MTKAVKRAINPAYARIALRYGAGILAGYSLVPKEITDMVSADPELAGVVATLIAVGVEGFYALDRRFGWRT